MVEDERPGRDPTSHEEFSGRNFPAPSGPSGRPLASRLIRTCQRNIQNVIAGDQT
jgi:hypothetical protein